MTFINLIPPIYINVKQYGAVGDGTTDDTSAIAAAVTVAGNAGGGVVFCPAGTYITTTITLPNRVWLRGAGMKATVIKLKNGTNSHVVKNFVSPDGIQANAEYCGVLDLTINGNKANQSGTSHGIYFTMYPTSTQATNDDDFDSHQLVQNVFILNALTDGFNASGRSGTQLHNVQVYYAGHYGFTPSFDTELIGCVAGNSGVYGFNLSASSLRLTNCKSFYSGQVTASLGYGFYINGSTSGVSLASCEAQDNQASGFVLDTVDRCTLVGCVADSNSTSSAGTYPGIDFWDTTNCLVEGLVCYERKANGSNSWQTQALRMRSSSTGNQVSLTHSAANGATISVPIMSSSTSLAANDLRINSPATYINVMTYGARADGTTNDTVSIQAAINAATNGGTVYFPPGTYMVSAALTFPVDGITLLGAGKGLSASIIKKSANIDLIDASGTGTGPSSHRHHCQIRNLTLHGNNLTGKLLRLYYCDTMVIDSCYFYANNDMAIETVEFWDSYFTNCFWEFCGDTAGTKPSVYIKNSVASSGFGFSSDNTNMVWFVNCHWEQFYAGALWIDAGVGNTSNPNGIYLVNCKMETTLVMGPFLNMTGYCINVHVQNLYISGDSFNAGYSTPVPAIGYYPNTGCVLDGVYANANAAVFSSIVDVWPSGGNTRISNLTNSGVAPTVAVINCRGNSTQLSFDNIKSNTGVLFASSTTLGFVSPQQNIVDAPSYASSYTPDTLNTGNLVVISPVTGVMTLNAPTFKWPGARLAFLLTSDSTGGYALTWNTTFKATQTSLPTVMPGANATLSVGFTSDGTNWYRTF